MRIYHGTFTYELSLRCPRYGGQRRCNSAPAPATQIGFGGRREAVFPTLYLLRGLSDDHTIRQRRTSIERYAAKYGIAIVMPNGDRSWYTDMAHGCRYFTFVSE